MEPYDIELSNPETESDPLSEAFSAKEEKKREADGKKARTPAKTSKRSDYEIGRASCRERV